MLDMIPDQFRRRIHEQEEAGRMVTWSSDFLADLRGQLDSSAPVDTHEIKLGGAWQTGTSPLREFSLDEIADREPPQISRGDLFSMASSIREHSGPWLPLLVASYAWGTGTTGYGASRLMKILDSGREDIERRLDKAARILVSEGPVEAFFFLRNFGTDAEKFGRTPGLGPAFFTKFLYFASPRVGSGGSGALILDKVLAQELRRGSPVDLQGLPNAMFRTADYACYLAAMLNLAAEVDREPDEVECVLFANASR